MVCTSRERTSRPGLCLSLPSSLFLLDVEKYPREIICPARYISVLVEFCCCGSERESRCWCLAHCCLIKDGRPCGFRWEDGSRTWATCYSRRALGSGKNGVHFAALLDHWWHLKMFSAANEHDITPPRPRAAWCLPPARCVHASSTPHAALYGSSGQQTPVRCSQSAMR